MRVKAHTSLKHRILGTYYKICRQVMKHRILHYVDLYAGDGECVCPSAPMPKWKPPFFSGFLEKVEPESLMFDCVFNEPEEEYHKSIVKALEPYKKYLLTKVLKEDANTVYKKVLKLIPPDEWSIFYLDPFRHFDLDWVTVKNIAEHNTFDNKSRCIRRPELIINLMTMSMQRVIHSDQNSITKALGTDEWKKLKSEYEDEGKPLYQLFRDIYIAKLESLGYSTIDVRIEQTRPNRGVLYFLIFATTIPNVSAIHKRFEKDCKRYISDKWTKETFKYNMMYKAKQKGNGLLTKWFN